MPVGALIGLIVFFTILGVAIIILTLKAIKLLIEIKRATKESYYDSYTGLSSVDMFKDNLTYVINSATDKSKMVVMSLGLDNLEEIGRLLGVGNNDLLLKETIARIKTSIRSTDLVARDGKGHFYILLTRVVSYDDIEMLAQRVIRSFSETFFINERELVLNPYIGISVYPENGKDVSLLLNSADSSRHRAKVSGSNNYYFCADELNHNSKKYDLLIKDMRQSIQTGDFILHYQPLYSLNTNSMTGVEALVRWNHPIRGLISPAEFIPAAESSGLIIPLGYWILREACRQYKEWDMPDLKLSVNLSAHQFRQKDLVQKIKEIIEQEGMQTDRLNLEITESTSMSDINYTLKVLNELRKMGLLLSIDDFGTGYSSLAYLKQFPITTLKIDRSFINDIDTSKNGEAVIKTIINLAKSLELRVVAEGVETEEQLSFLRKLHCDKVQGFLLSKPLPSHELNAFMLDERQKIIV